jgi:hemoglobin
MDKPVSIEGRCVRDPDSGVVRIDRISEGAIRRLVGDFYVKVRADPELGPIFARAIPGDWEPHLAKMCDFWSSVMLTMGRYKGNPLAARLRIDGMEARLFGRWLELFAEDMRRTLR